MNRAILCLALLSAVTLSGQTVMPTVRVAIDATSLTRGRTSQVRVSVTIPQGYYVPAETRGELHGAWLRVVDDREPEHLRSFTPSYPIPERVENVLAYQHANSFAVPVYAPELLEGTQPLVVEFGFQLCDEHACRPFERLRTRVDLPLAEPRVAAESANECCFAFTVDATHLAILVGRELKPIDKPTELDAPNAAFGLSVLPDDPADIPASQSKGSTWVVGVDGRQFAAVVERFAAIGAYGSRPELALVARVDSPAFQRERTQYFVAWPREKGKRLVESRSIVRALQFTDVQRKALDALIEAQMRITLPTMLARAPQPPPGSYDERVLNGKARLVTHVEAFKLAPDADTRLFVRAYWAAAGRAQTGLTLWIRVHDDELVVEDVDFGITELAREDIVARNTLTAAADGDGYADFLMNVVQAPDGWAYLIMKSHYYEGRAVSVYKYSPKGPVGTGMGSSEGE